MKRAPKDPEPAKHWLAFPRNHWKLSLRWTSSLFRRYQSTAKFLIFDRDGKYGIEVPAGDPVDENPVCSHFGPESLAE
jgi:hypothetical protein